MKYAMAEMSVKEVREYLKTNQTIIFPYGGGAAWLSSALEHRH